MATTNAPIVWEFYKKIDATDIGGVVDYFTADGQSVYRTDNGIATKIAKIEEGHWQDAEFGEEINLAEDAFSDLAFDHPYYGEVYGAAIDDSALWLLRYQYAVDIGHYLENAKIDITADNPIVQTSITLKNPGFELFGGDGGLLLPGARIEIAIAYGNSEKYPLMVAYLDSIDYDKHSPTLSISGRNSIGFFLADQTFDENIEFEGRSDEVVEEFFRLAGITKYDVQTGDYPQYWKFKPDMTFLDGFRKMQEFYYGSWNIMELADGTVLVGYYWWDDRPKNSVYQFDGNTEAIKRKTRKSSDAAYSRIAVSGVDPNGVELETVYKPVGNYEEWNIGATKTKYERAPDGMTQEQLEEYAEELAQENQYIGILETFDSPMRPQLMPNDIASIYYDDSQSVDLGLITSITHAFGERGFFTSFTVDSGGVSYTEHGYEISRSAEAKGYNRRQNMKDLVDIMARKQIENSVKSGEISSSAGAGGVPPLGSAGQILAKASGTSYDTEWVDNFKWWIGTEEEYDDIQIKEEDRIYFITDD